MEYSWKYCLNDEQYAKFVRIINKIPGFVTYLREHNTDDFLLLTEGYMGVLAENGRSTAGIRMNLNLLNTYYTQYRFEYIDANKRPTQLPTDFQLDRVLSWPQRPKWAESMEVKEIDYLDHFIWQVKGLSKHLYENKDALNLYDIVAQFQMMLNVTGKNNPDTNFTLETIKERFYRIMDDHKDAIHYVNHSHQIDDHQILQEFLTEAKNGFYLVNLEKDICSDFTTKWLKTPHPYVASECFVRFFRANNIHIALNFARQAFAYTFSSPNIYWHNKEAIYGCANILYLIIDALREDGIQELRKKNETLLVSAVEILYHLLSRVIYWTDKETVKTETYDDKQLPIQIQHKLRAYRLRANLIRKFGTTLLSSIFTGDPGLMELSDLYTAHFIAYSNRIVGKDSVFMRDAIRIFHTQGYYSHMSPEMASEKGYTMSNNLAQSLHTKYKEGKYSLPEKNITDFVGNLRIYFKNKKTISIKEDIPLSYLEADNFNPSYKPNKEQIKQYLKDNGIEYFYHVTDKDRLKSIVKYQGLLSYKRCLDEGVVMPIRKDMAESRDLDAKFGLEDFTRVSFCMKLPKTLQRLKEGGEFLLLKISTDVALFENTEFTDIEATTDGVRHGASFEDLKAVNIQATKMDINDEMSNTTYLQRQAEVLVKGIIPLKYIINVKNPEKFG